MHTSTLLCMQIWGVCFVLSEPRNCTVSDTSRRQAVHVVCLRIVSFDHLLVKPLRIP